MQAEKADQEAHESVAKEGEREDYAALGMPLPEEGEEAEDDEVKQAFVFHRGRHRLTAKGSAVRVGVNQCPGQARMAGEVLAVDEVADAADCEAEEHAEGC